MIKLPSKQFLIRGGIATGIVAIILIIQTNWFQGLFGRKGTLSDTPVAVGEIVAQDSNGNGIPDWEEKLWGLDPKVLYTGDMSNREIIENKKRALGLAPSGNDEPLTESDRLARQLFSISASVGEAGMADDGTLSSLGEELGRSADVTFITNRYQIKDIKTIKTTPSSLSNYYKSLLGVLNKYSDNTANIEVVIAGIENGDYSRISELSVTAATYRQLARELSTIITPVGVVPYHIDIINGYAGVADSFISIMQIEEDGAQSIAGFSAYKNYSLSLTAALYDLNEYLTQYGIL